MCRASVSHRFTLSCFPGGCFFDLRVRGRWLSFQAEGDFPAVFVSFHGDQEGTAERPAWQGPHVPGADVGSAAWGAVVCTTGQLGRAVNPVVQKGPALSRVPCAEQSSRGQRRLASLSGRISLLFDLGRSLLPTSHAPGGSRPREV